MTLRTNALLEAIGHTSERLSPISGLIDAVASRIMPSVQARATNYCPSGGIQANLICFEGSCTCFDTSVCPSGQGNFIYVSNYPGCPEIDWSCVYCSVGCGASC